MLFIMRIFFSRKLRNILTTRIIKFLLEKSKKEPEEYAKFYADHNIFLKSGIVFADMQETRVNILIKP